MNIIPEEVRHLYPNHVAAAADQQQVKYEEDVRDRARTVYPGAGNNDDDDYDDYDGHGQYRDDFGDEEDEEEEEEREEDEIDRIADDDPILQDEQLFNEVLAYLMKGGKTDYSDGGGNLNISQMPSALSRALGNRHVRVESEPRDIIPGPVRLIDLPVGLALLFDVATDEAFTERWRSRTLEPLKAAGDAAEAAEAGGAAADKAEGSAQQQQQQQQQGAAAAAAAEPSSSSSPAKQDGEDKKTPEKKSGGGGDGGGDDGASPNSGHGKKGRRIIEKPAFGFTTPKPKPPVQKKYSTLLKPAPRPKVEYQLVSDINAGMQLPGPPQWIPYIAYLCALPSPRPDRCIALYESGLALVDDFAQRKELAAQKKAEDELKPCTFKPEVTDAVKKMPGWKGDMVKFYADKLDWKKQMARKMEKKLAKHREEQKELYAQWEMPQDSKRILQRRERRLRALQESGDSSQQRAVDRRGIDLVVSADQSPLTGGDRSVSSGADGVGTGAAAAAAVGGGFVPVTNSHRFRHLTAVRGLDSRSGSNAEGGANAPYNFTAILDEFSPPEELVNDQLTQKQFLSRMKEDLAGRMERKRERAIRFARQQKEKLFDPLTGQPLFEPNAAPTVVRQDGQRVSFHDLSSKEKKDLIRKLKQRGRLDFIPGVSKDRTSDHTVDAEEVQEMYKRMLEKVRTGEKKIDRIRKKEETELTKLFRPTIDKRTSKLIAQQGIRKPVYALPLPTKPPPPPPKPKPKSNDAKMNNVAERNSVFQSTKLDTQKKMVENKLAKEVCSFQPKVSATSNRIVSERRAQWQKEIATLEMRREEIRQARQSGDIHYASEMMMMGIEHQHQQPRSLTGSGSGGRQHASPPVGNFQRQQQFYDPVAERDRQREEHWTRPEARRVASHYYFESDHPQRRPSPTLLGGSGQVAAAIAAKQNGGGDAAAKRMAGFHHYDQQQQQQQPVAASGAEPGYDDIDALVGSMLNKKGSPANPSSSSAAQALKFSPENNVAAGAGGERSLSEQQQSERLAAIARARQQQRQQQQRQPPASSSSSPTRDSESASGQRLRNILHSWEELERQTEAALNF